MKRRDYVEADRRRRTSADVEAPAESDSDDESDEGPEDPELNIPVALGCLLAATGLTYLTAEALTDSLETIGQTGGVSKEWLGLILLAVVGNAAEHVTAVFVAYRNKVDLALAVSVGSCIQIALFVIPALVLIGWAANKPLSLLFDPLETVTLFLSVLLVRFATEDGRTHYMSGVALLGTYVLIAFAFWYYPSQGTDVANLFGDGTCA
jgi:Ca2+:H+ antiporter